MSARHPATVSLSLEEFSRHGGLTGPHKGGWSMGWYEHNDIRPIKEIHPAASRACVRFLQPNPFSSSLVVSHVRKATLGPVASRNCQPFVHGLGGVWHCFAHNGNLPDIASDSRFRAEGFRPVGETDSEQAFGAPMDSLRPLWRPGPVPSLTKRKEVVSRFSAALRELGPANLLYGDGDRVSSNGQDVASLSKRGRHHQTIVPSGSKRSPIRPLPTRAGSRVRIIPLPNGCPRPATRARHRHPAAGSARALRRARPSPPSRPNARRRRSRTRR